MTDHKPVDTGRLMRDLATLRSTLEAVPEPFRSRVERAAMAALEVAAPIPYRMEFVRYVEDLLPAEWDCVFPTANNPWDTGHCLVWEKALRLAQEAEARR